MDALRTTILAVVIIGAIGACLYYARGSKASDLAEIRQLKRQVEDSQREVSELRRLNAETVKRLGEAIAITESSKGTTSAIRDEVTGSRVLVDESLGDIEYIREALNGLPVLGVR